MRRFLPFLALAAMAPAQTITTAPAGYEHVRGTASTPYPFSSDLSSAGTFRYQEVHTSLVGTPLSNLIAASFRRDESRTFTSSAVARTARIEFVLGHGDIERYTPDFEHNYTNGRSVVFARRPVNLVDWRGPGNSTLEPWTNRIPFDTAFSYNGTDALVWEVSYDSLTPTGMYNADRAAGGGNLWTSAAAASLGIGCVLAGRTNPFLLTTTLFHHIGSRTARMQAFVSDGPPSAAVVLSFDTAATDLLLPNLCTRLRVLPTVSLPLGVTNAAGATSPVNYLTFTFTPPFTALHVFAQAVALDASLPPHLIPVALSQAQDCQWPALDVTTPATAAYTYSIDLGATFGSGPFTAGSVICGFEQ
jgi:hypothetical protein